MARQTIDQQMVAMRTAGPDELRKALRSEKGILIAAAAKRIAEERIDLAEELAAAFATIPDAKRDPICRGKIAIAKALQELDTWDERVFVAGLRVVQMEGPPPQTDTAAELRGVCGLAHVQFAQANALDVLAALFADSERNTRQGAAQGLGDSGRPGASALLRYVLLTQHEQDPDVIAQCFDSLFALDRDSAEAFAIEMLARHDERGEAAAIALGSHRVASAASALVAWSDVVRPAQRHRVGYVALALLRADIANAALLDAIRTRHKTDAIAAAKALATFKDDTAVAASVRDAIRELDAGTRREIESILAG